MALLGTHHIFHVSRIRVKAWRLVVIRNIDSVFENRVLREIFICKGGQEVIEEG